MLPRQTIKSIQEDYLFCQIKLLQKDEYIHSFQTVYKGSYKKVFGIFTRFFLGIDSCFSSQMPNF